MIGKKGDMKMVKNVKVKSYERKGKFKIRDKVKMLHSDYKAKGKVIETLPNKKYKIKWPNGDVDICSEEWLYYVS
jgi:hypothetical protein